MGVNFFLLLGKDAFSVKVNHRDIFVRNPVLKYDDEDKTLLLDIDEDKWSFFKLVGILKDDIKCTSDFKLWWTRVNDVGIIFLTLGAKIVLIEHGSIDVTKMD